MDGTAQELVEAFLADAREALDEIRKECAGWSATRDVVEQAMAELRAFGRPVRGDLMEVAQHTRDAVVAAETLADAVSMGMLTYRQAITDVSAGKPVRNEPRRIVRPVPETA